MLQMPNNNTLDQKHNKAAPVTLKTSAYNKKILSLRRKITVNAAVSAFIIILIIAAVFVNSIITKGNDEDIEIVNTKINELKTKSANIETRIIEVKTYRQVWANANTKTKNFDGVKIADVNSSFNLLAEKYGIGKPTINISVPEILKGGIYDRQVLDVNLINCTINFDSTTDKVAIDFIDNFLSSLPGYTTINDLSITKGKKDGYGDIDLLDISTGKIAGLTSVKTSFSWYFLKRKPIVEAPKKW